MKNYSRAKYALISGLLTVCTLLPASPAQAALVGSTPGSFSVSPGGAATYSIPIQVPPGIAGMQPQLAFVYSSNSPNGLLGLGWNIAGLSQVGRCPATLAQDSLIDGIDFDSNDKFCLDGQRLVSTGTGTDGNGAYTQYRTEIDSFSRVRSYGTAGNGPASFRVRTRSGTEMEYGVTTDSRIEAQGKSDVLVWALNKVLDTSGNYMTVSYTEDSTTNGEYRVSQIDYTGNAGESVSTYASVQFSYTTRTDTILHYISGSKRKTTQKLTNVKTYVGSTLVKDYQLTYGSYGAASLARITAITECDGQGTPECLPATQFTWKTEDTGFDQGGAAPDVIYNYDDVEPPLSPIRPGEYGDLNGDGLLDWVHGYYYDGTPTKETRLNTGGGWSSDQDYLLPGSTLIRNYDAGPPRQEGDFVDVNSDGLSDWVYAFENTSGTATRTTYLNTGSGWASDSGYQLPTVITDYDDDGGGERGGEFVDVNGDGRPDWVRAYQKYSNGSNVQATYLNTGSGWSADTDYDLPDVIMDYDANADGVRRGEFVDVNGDGLMDWVRAYRSVGGTNQINTWLNTGSGWSDDATYDLPVVIMDYETSGARKRGEFADVNGDGLVDFVRAYENASGTVTKNTYLNTGSGWSEHSGYQLPTVITDYDNLAAGERYGEFVDVNADGLVDWVVAFKNWQGTGTRQTYLNTGTGWSEDTGHTYRLPNVIQDFAEGRRYGDFYDLNGDGIRDWVRSSYTSSDPVMETWVLPSNAPGLITKITSGLGVETDITYKYLTDIGSGVYTRGSATYPEIPVQTSMLVVSQVSVDDGIGGNRVQNYTYTGLKSHFERQQLLGFASVKVVEVDVDASGTDIHTTTNYNQTFPYIGMVSLVEKKKDGSSYISSAQYFYDEQADGGGSAECTTLTDMPALCKLVEKAYDLDSGTLLVTTTTETTYDSYNNPDLVTTTTVGNSETFITEIDNTFSNDTTNWLLGFLDRSEVQKTHPDTSTATQIVEYDYDSGTGLLIREIVEPDSSDQNIRLTTVHTRDDFGNITRTTLCDGAITPTSCTESSTNARSTQMSYTSNDSSYPNGLFMTGVTNALSQSESRVYDVKFGVLTSLTGPNGLTTEWDYDTLGRKILEDRADGTATEITYTDCTSCPTVGSTPAEYFVTTEVTGRAPQDVYLDAFNRQIRERTTYDGTNYVYVDTKYNAQYRVVQVSEPYYSGDTPVWTVYDYDAIGRVVEVDPAHTAELVTTDYSGFSTTTTNVEDQVEVQTINAIGQVVSVTEADGDTEEVTTVYRYDAAGNLEETEVNDDNASIIQITYDVRGRKTALDDPDMGEWDYVHNAFGELISQTDAKSQITTMEYDALGRMTLRVDDDGGADVENTWTWGTSSANKNIGKLTGMSVEGGSSTSYTYDSFGRPYQTTSSIDSISFVVTQAYDGTTGMPTVTTYPATTKYSSGFQARRIYNSSGILIRVETTDATPFVFWQADPADRNARGQVEAETLGNGIDTVRVFNEATGWLEATESINSNLDAIHHAAYTYDDLGNLLTRTDYLPSPDVVETFTYDNLNRMLTSQRTGQPVPIEYAYDALGNITANGGVDDYSYTGCSSGPHAVCSADGNSYSYDANGNMASRDGYTVTYTGFNLPYEFKNGSTVQASFEYDANRNRVLKTAGSLEVRYVGMTGTGNPLFEQEDDGSTIRNIHYIYADGAQAVAQHITIGSGAETQYFHRDHLGSVEAISDDSGDLAAVDYVSYDPWGSRVDSPDAENVRLGFTGHETISEQAPDLVHMNGRVYDPLIARFVSADPTIPNPFSSQSYNRYSYVSNNPLSFTDPSGFTECAPWQDVTCPSAAQEGENRETVEEPLERIEGQDVFTCDEACRERGRMLEDSRMSFTSPGTSGYSSWLAGYAADGGGGYYSVNQDFGGSSGLGVGRVVQNFTGGVLTKIDNFFAKNKFGVSVGLSGTLGGGPVPPIPGPFVGGGITVTLTTDLQLIVTLSGNVQAGTWAFAGVGGEIGVYYSDSVSETYSTDVSIHTEGNFGFGESVGASIDIGKDASVSRGISYGVGYGASVSGGLQQNVSFATSPGIKWGTN